MRIPPSSFSTGITTVFVKCEDTGSDTGSDTGTSTIRGRTTILLAVTPYPQFCEEDSSRRQVARLSYSNRSGAIEVRKVHTKRSVIHLIPLHTMSSLNLRWYKEHLLDKICVYRHPAFKPV
jgi:hypothetical protein